MLGWLGTQVHVSVRSTRARSRRYHGLRLTPLGPATSNGVV